MKRKNDRQEYMKKCLECRIELPLHNEEGKHNFCPKSTDNGEIIEICMKCKMKEIIVRWKG